MEERKVRERRGRESPATATIRHDLNARSRSPLRNPQRIIVAWTAPNRSRAPLPAEKTVVGKRKCSGVSKEASAEIQLLLLCDVVFRIVRISQSAIAPEKMRTKVKVPASMLVCFSAARQEASCSRKRSSPRASRKKCLVSGGQRPMLNRQSVRILRTRRRAAPVAAARRGRHLCYS